MNVTTRASTRAMRRVGFTFASDGSHAACLASGADGGWYAESWRLPPTGPAVPTALALPGSRSESLHAQLVPLPDGRVLVCRRDGDRHELVLLSPGDGPAGPGAHDGRGPDHRTYDGSRPPGPAAEERQLAALRTPGLRLLPMPVPADGRVAPGAPVALAIGSDGRPVTTVWLVRADGGEPERIAEVPGLYGGGVWLDRDGRLLALDRVHDGVVRTVVLDLGPGEVTPLLEIGERSNDRLVLFDPDTRFLMVRSDAPGADRLGWGVLGGGERLRFPDCLHVPGVFLRPVALRPSILGPPPAAPFATGPRPAPGSVEAVGVAVQIDHGAASALALWQPGATGWTRCPYRPAGSARSATGRRPGCGCPTPLPTIRPHWPPWTWTPWSVWARRERPRRCRCRCGWHR